MHHLINEVQSLRKKVELLTKQLMDINANTMVTSARASTAAAIATTANEDVGRAIELGETTIATTTTAQGIAEAI